jgi:hypothetical protein
VGEDDAQDWRGAFHDEGLSGLVLCGQGLPEHAYVSVDKVAVTMTLRVFDV